MGMYISSYKGKFKPDGDFIDSGLPQKTVSARSLDVYKKRLEAIGCQRGDSKFGEVSCSDRCCVRWDPECLWGQKLRKRLT